MRLNAEGVETNLQADILRIEGCDEVQGYFFGKPMSLTELKPWIEDISGTDKYLENKETPASDNGKPGEIVRIA